MITKDDLTNTRDPGMNAQESAQPGVIDLPEQYEVLGKINHGGMGTIFRAKNRYTNQQVAIKVIKASAKDNEKALARFIAEAKAASSLNHPRICQVRDFGLTKTKIPYLVMDWIDGIPLGKKIQRDGREQPAEAVVIFLQICAGLEHAHSHRVVHRDLKPDNIMLTRDLEGRTEVHLVDFGIAKVLSSSQGNDNDSELESEEKGQSKNKQNLTTTGAFLGTPLFMSPEQARASATIDHRSDIYSLGCLMYYVLIGEAPLVGVSAIDTITKHLHEMPPDFPPRFKIAPDLRAIVFKCIEKGPSDRYQSVADIISDLKKVSKGVNITRQPLVSEREQKRKKTMRMALFVAGFGLMYAISISIQSVLDSRQHSASGVASANKAATVEHKKHAMKRK